MAASQYNNGQSAQPNDETKKEKVAVGFDHAGFVLRDIVLDRVKAAGHLCIDMGTKDSEPVDYPDFAHKVAGAVSRGEADWGVLVCGTGLGMCYAANRHKGVRAAACTNAYLAEMSRRHNDAKVLCLGARVIGPGVAARVLDIFFSTDYEGGRHQRRIAKIEL